MWQLPPPQQPLQSQRQPLPTQLQPRQVAHAQPPRLFHWALVLELRPLLQWRTACMLLAQHRQPRRVYHQCRGLRRRPLLQQQRPIQALVATRLRCRLTL